jgi:alanine racemase
MTRPLRSLIDLSALKYNSWHIKNIIQNKKIMAMVKANGYGHGLKLVAESLLQVDNFGVACLEEAMELRSFGVTKPITIMQGFFAAEDLKLIDKFTLDVVIHSNWQVEILEKYTGRALNVWLKINTGMNRLGFIAEECISNFKLLIQQKNIKILGFMTHFAAADNINNPKTIQQFALFKDVVTDLPPQYLLSAANSAAILNWPDTWCDFVRPGIMLYGISPFSNCIGTLHGLRPVMTLETKIIAINTVKKDHTVGYDGRYVCNENTRIGIIAIGYGDGYPRNAPDGTPVLLNGYRASIAGCVAMDMISINLNSHPNAKIGDKVILWGGGLPIEEVATAIGTIPYELITSLTPRVPRVPVSDNQVPNH